MFKNHTVAQETINDRIHRYECTPNTPLGEAYDFLTRMRSYIFNLMAEEQAKLDKKKAEEEQEKEGEIECPEQT